MSHQWRVVTFSIVLQVNRVHGKSCGPYTTLGSVHARSGKVGPSMDWERKQGQYIRSVWSIASLTSQNWPVAKPNRHWTFFWLSSCNDADIPRNVTWDLMWAQSSVSHRNSFLKVCPTKWTSSINMKPKFWENFVECRSQATGTVCIISGPIPITSHPPSSASFHILQPSTAAALSIFELMAIKQIPWLHAFPS